MVTSWHVFVRLFLPLAACVATGALVYGHLEVEGALTGRRELERVHVSHGTDAVASSIEPLAGELLFLARSSSLRDALDEPTPGRLAALAEGWAAYLENRRPYVQVRWVALDGQERLRVARGENGTAVVLPSTPLPRNGVPPDLEAALSLAPGAVSVVCPDFEGSVSNKPLLRVATPVAGTDGRKRGVLIIDHDGSVIRQAFARALPDRGLLLDRRGNGLSDLQAGMAVRAPGAWQGMQAVDQGQADLDDGLWTWETIRPSVGAARREACWKAVVHWPAAQREALVGQIRGRVAGSAALLLVLAGLGSWKLARVWALLAESETKYQTLSKFAYDWETWISPTRQPLFSSPSCERVTGRPAAAFMADPDFLRDIAHPDDQALVDEHLLHHIDRDDACEFCFRIVLPDGQIRWIEHICLPVFSESGEFLGRRASNRDVTDRKNDEAHIQQLAFFDVLTGLPNRRLLSDRLDHALAQARRFKRSLAVMFLDLDHFKQVNDTLGHAAGDELLKIVAGRLQACVRSGDTIARQGGDEFIVVLAEIARPGDAAGVAEKIIQAIGEPVQIAGTPLGVTTSIGIAVYPVDGSDDAQELLKKADRAMYAAKAAGRNAYRFFAA